MGLETIAIAAVVSAVVSSASYAVQYALTPKAQPKGQDNARSVDPRVQGSRFGVVIDRVYGTIEKAGQVIWATPIRDDVSFVPGTRNKRGGTPDQTNHIYRRSFGILFCERPASGFLGVSRIKFDDKTFAAATGGGLLGEVGSNYEIKLGAADQLPNTWYEADKGVGQVSAHRGYVTVWFYDIDLGPYGDRIPNVRVELVQAVDPTLDDVVAEECAVADLSPSDINVTALSGDVVHGFFVNSQGPVRSSLEQLSLAYQFDGVDYDGKINFRKRPQSPVAVVPWEDLGAVEEDESVDEDEPAPMVSLSRKLSAEIASNVDVLYFDSARDYEEGTQSFRRQNFTSGETVPRSFNLVFTPQEASRLAKIIAVVGWAERVPGKYSLPSDYFIYACGDVLTIPLDATETKFVDMRIEKMSFASPGVVRIDCVEQFEEAYDQTGDGDAGSAAPDPDAVITPCPTRVWMSDRQPHNFWLRARYGHFVAAAPDETCDPVAGGSWTGVSLLRDVDGAGELRQHAVIARAATMGETLTVFTAGSGIDTTQTVDAHFISGAPVSITDDAFNADQTVNLFAIGGETCQVRDVEDLGGGDYRFSHIRRAMHGTVATGHVTGEPVVLLDEAVAHVEHNAAEVGNEFTFYPVSFGGTVNSATPFAFTYGAYGVEDGAAPPSEVQNHAVLDQNGTPILQWQEPAQNTQTLRGYRVEVFEDPGMTIPVSGYEEVEVKGNQLVLPVL